VWSECCPRGSSCLSHTVSLRCHLQLNPVALLTVCVCVSSNCEWPVCACSFSPSYTHSSEFAFVCVCVDGLKLIKTHRSLRLQRQEEWHCVSVCLCVTWCHHHLTESECFCSQNQTRILRIFSVSFIFFLPQTSSNVLLQIFSRILSLSSCLSCYLSLIEIVKVVQWCLLIKQRVINPDCVYY